MDYRHIPTKIEIADYIRSRFGMMPQEGPISSRFMWRMFYHGCGIEGAQECTCIETDKGLDWTLFEVKTHLDVMNIETKKFEAKEDRYAIALWNQRPHARQRKEFQDITDISEDHRFRLIIDLLDDDPTLWKNEFVMDAKLLSALIEAEPSGNPSLSFFEGSIAWMAKQRDNADTGSGVGLAEFANTQLRFLIKDRLGEDLSVDGRSLDAEHAEIRIRIPYDETLPCHDGNGHLGLEPSLTFAIPAYGGVIVPFIRLGYWKEKDDEIKNWDICEDFPFVQEYGKNHLRGVPGITIPTPDVDSFFNPIGAFDPYEYRPDDFDGFLFKTMEWVSTLMEAFRG